MVSTGKVGDTINAKVEPADATDPTFAWAADGTPILGATTASYVVGEADLGKKISVTVTGVDGSTFTAETAAVEAAAGTALTLLSAEQTGAATIAVKFSAKATADDKLTVKRGTVDQVVDVEYDADFLGATLTLGTKMSDATYTVTLTPADTTQKATSKEIVAKSTKLTKIEFLNNYLVMANAKFNEGYTFVKGYNDFDEEVVLSGVNITTGIGDATYKASTGLLTIKAADNAFLNMKEVYVYVLDTSANISASATLEVSSQAFVSEMTLGDIEKDGTKRTDGLITIEELNSGKYYIPVTAVKDQYGNNVDAETLNKMKKNNTLFVIPNAETKTYYSAEDFDTKKDGTIIIPLKKGGSTKPGTMNLTVTSANGSSFAKEVTISDNPFIDALTIEIPDLYKNTFAEVTFSAVDQYGEDINLWDFRPAQPTGTDLEFTDENHLTGLKTKISANNVAWKVTEDTAKKTFKVLVKATSDKDSTIVFTSTTAGQKIGTIQKKVAGTATPASIRRTLSGGDTVLSAANATFDFGKYLTFVDNTGAVVNSDSIYGVTMMTDTQATGWQPSADVKENPTNFWCLVTYAEPNSTAGSALAASGAGKQLGDVVAGTTSPHKLNLSDGIVTLSGTTVPAKDYTFYATLYTEGKTSGVYALDQQKFTVTVANTTVDSKTKFSAEIADGKKTLYAGTKYADSAKINVYGENDGVKFKMQASDYTLEVDKGLVVSGTTITNDKKDMGSGSATVTVWTVVGGKDTAVATVALPYSNDAPVQTGWMIYDESNDEAITATEFDKVNGYINTLTGLPGTIDVVNGVLMFSDDGDNILVYAIDQYGNGTVIEGEKWTLNGNAWSGGPYTLTAYDSHTVKGSLSKIDGIALTLVPEADVATTYTQDTAATVASEVELTNAINKGTTTITLGADIDTTKLLKVPADVELVIPSKYTLDTKTNPVTVEADGKITVEGLWTAGASTVINDGTVEGPGHVTLNGTTITTAGPGTGVWNLTGTSLELINAVFAGNQELQGHIIVATDITIDAGVTVTLSQNVDNEGKKEETKVEFGAGVNSNKINGSLNVAQGSSVNAVTGGTQQALDNSTGTGDANITKIDASGVTSEVTETTERVMDPIKLTTKGDTDDDGTLNGEDNLINAFGEVGTLTRDNGTWSVEDSTMTYQYTYNGTLSLGWNENYAEGKKANDELKYPADDLPRYVVPLQIPSLNSVGAKQVVLGEGFTVGTEVPDKGKMTLTVEKYPNVVVWVPGYKAAGDKTLTATYEFADKTKVTHIITLTEDNFEKEANYSVSGTVATTAAATSFNVSDVTVTLATSESGKTFSKTATTDSKGAWTVTGVPAGSYTATVGPGTGYSSEPATVKVSDKDVTDVTITVDGPKS